MPLYDHAGNAPAAQLTATLTNVGLTASCDNLTNWPAGGGNGKFWITLARGTPNEERLLGQSTSGNTITIAALSDRGLEDTAAVEHPAGTTIEHTFSKTEAQDANDHIFNVALDQHTQYMRADGTRHDLTARHSAGTVIPTAAPVAIGTALAEGAGTNLARSTHVHTIGAGAINNSSMFAAGIVNAAAIGTGAVGSDELAALAVIAGKIANNAVTTATILDDNVTAAKIADGAIDATPKIANAIITLAKMALEDPINYNPVEGDFSSDGSLDTGTGGTTYGYHYKVGLLEVGWCGFSMAADGNLPGTATIRVPVPFTQKALGTMRGFCAARTRQVSSPFSAFSGTGLILAGNNFGQNIVTAGAGAEWDSITPYNWGSPGVGAVTFDAVFFGVASS